MAEMSDDSWENPLARQLSWVLASVSNVSDMQKLLRDLLTDKEIVEISARLEAARLLAGGARYADVIGAAEVSSRTVARVSSWLSNGCGGYPIAIDLLQKHQRHTRPVAS